MRISLTTLMLAGVVPLYASGIDTESWVSYLALAGVGAGIVGFVLWGLCRSKLKTLTATLKEREEKIQWFRQLTAKHEQEKVKSEHETEKQILKMRHTIETLERELKEGSKNQVVAKIEAQQRKREAALARTDLGK